jgi:DNA polymerase-3 subunit epsilon
MLDWIKNINKEYPEFWKLYQDKFENKSNRIVVLHTNCTGFNPKKDVILSIGAIGISNEVIKIGDTFEVEVLQYKYLHDNELSHDYLSDSTFTKLAEPQAIQALVDYIGSSVLVGHRIHFEIEMINYVLENMGCGKLRNEALDIEIMQQKLVDANAKSFPIEELIQYHKIQVHDSKTVSDTSYSIALLFLKLKSKLGF